MVLTSHVFLDRSAIQGTSCLSLQSFTQNQIRNAKGDRKAIVYKTRFYLLAFINSFFPFLQALDDLINKGLPQILHTVGQQHLLNKFSFVKAYLLVSVAATINYVPENIVKSAPHGYVSEKSKTNFSNLKGNLFIVGLLFFLLSCSNSAPLHPQ